MSLINKISQFFRKQNQKIAQEKEGKSDIHGYIGKFVKQNGSDIGESIAVDKTRFIVKNQEGFISVPISVVLKNNENIEVGDFDTEESFRLGKAWFEKKDTLK
jgi:hypothetical protein